MLCKIVGRLTGEEVGGDTVENASDHHWCYLPFAGQLAEGHSGLRDDGLALGAVEDVIICFMKTLSSAAIMIDSVFVFLGPNVSYFIGSPEFEGEFHCRFATFAGSAV